jgi:hypothetical protein
MWRGMERKVLCRHTHRHSALLRIVGFGWLILYIAKTRRETPLNAACDCLCPSFFFFFFFFVTVSLGKQAGGLKIDGARREEPIVGNDEGRP